MEANGIMGDKGIFFRPFYLSEEIVERYFEWFNRAENRVRLYDGTPMGREEVRAWIISRIEDKKGEYFFAYKGDEMVGHIGLRGINRVKNFGGIGTFIPEKKIRADALERGIQYLINVSNNINLELLTAEFVDEEQDIISFFLEAGFVRVVGAPNYLTLKL
jgi:hypothetical protein